MRIVVSSFGCGVTFAIGLGVSGMTRPEKVIDFLDFFGKWDASLAFVMVGAIVVYSVAYRFSAKLGSPLLAARFAIPDRRDIDGKLLLGSTLFGIGWGLGGFCPGPALVSLASAALPVMVFVTAMSAGMLFNSWVERTASSAADWRVMATERAQDA
jgi:uncharacterized membrane protein YedE/YeeE